MYPLYLYLKNWLVSRDEGQDLAEYAILLVLIAVVLFAVVQILGQQIRGFFYDIIRTLGGTP